MDYKTPTKNGEGRSLYGGEPNVRWRSSDSAFRAEPLTAWHSVSERSDRSYCCPLTADEAALIFVRFYMSPPAIPYWVANSDSFFSFAKPANRR